MGAVAHTVIPATWEAKLGVSGFEVSKSKDN
jgi:hypothetical protein